MDLLINGPAVALSSLGVRRYFDSVMRHLAWPGRIEIIPSRLSKTAARPRELIRRGRKDAIFWTPCQRGPLNPHHHVVTVHDCISVEHVYPGDWRLKPYLMLFNKILDNAEAIVAISESSKAAVLRNYRVDETKLHVIRSGHERVATAAPPTTGPTARPAEAPYVLMVTNASPHKNTTAACEAFGRSRATSAGVTLRVVGSISAAAQDACARHGVKLETVLGISDSQLQTLYEGCLFLLSPSLAEGHNLPIAEALACGGNVLCSDIDVHREFYSGHVAFFDPLRVDDIVDALDAALLRPGRWFTQPMENRTFADVAREYESLFHAIGGHAAPKGTA